MLQLGSLQSTKIRVARESSQHDTVEYARAAPPLSVLRCLASRHGRMTSLLHGGYPLSYAWDCLRACVWCDGQPRQLFKRELGADGQAG